MLTLSDIMFHIVESIAITCAIYLVTKKTMKVKEIVVLVLSISASSLILSLFSPAVAAGVKQGSGFGLGYAQVAGNGHTRPRRYFDPNYPPSSNIETAKPDHSGIPSDTNSIILQEYNKSPFDTISQYASYP